MDQNLAEHHTDLPLVLRMMLDMVHKKGIMIGIFTSIIRLTMTLHHRASASLFITIVTIPNIAKSRVLKTQNVVE